MSKKMSFSVVSVLSCLGLVWIGQPVLAEPAAETIYIKVHSSSEVSGISSSSSSAVSVRKSYHAKSSKHRAINQRKLNSRYHTASWKSQDSTATNEYDEVQVPTFPSAALASSIAAQDSTSNSNKIAETAIQPFQLQPRFDIWGFTGDRTLAEGQFLWPLYGDQTRALYVNVQGNITNDEDWLGGAGFGYRQVVNNRIWGGYVFADYLSATHTGFWYVNPGLEMLGPVWDTIVNGYIPLDNKKRIDKAGWAGDDFCNFTFVNPTGHDLYDHFIKKYEEPERGLDLEVGRIVPYFDQAKVYLGVYHFDTSDAGSTNGVKARITYDFNKYSGLELENDYDDTNHNQIFIGVRFALGGYSKEEKDSLGIVTRLMDPNNSMLLRGTIGLTTTFVDMGAGKEHDNVWYYRAGARGTKQQGSGTAEDPFIGFNPENYAAINPNIGVIDKHPWLFFATGEYSFNGFSVIRNPGRPNEETINDRFNLPNGWGMYGRTSDYHKAAIGDARAKFVNSGLDMVYVYGTGNDPTTLNSIQIINNKSGNDNAALYIRNASNVILQNTNIENIFTNLSGDADVYGIFAANSTINFAGLNCDPDGVNTVTATIIAENEGEVSGSAYGMNLENNSIVNFNSGQNIVTGEAKASGFGTETGYVAASGIAFGMSIQESTINFNNGQNVIMGKAEARGIGTSVGSGSGSAKGYGILAISNSIINFNGGKNTIKGIGTGFGEFNVTPSSNDIMEGRGEGFGYGISAANNTTINFKDGQNEVTGEGLGEGESSISNVAGVGVSVGRGIQNVFGSKVNFSGGQNSITGIGTAKGNFTSTAEEAVSEAFATGNGIESDNSGIYFNGGNNVVTGNATAKNNSLSESTLGNSVAQGSGIFAFNSQLYLKGGQNTFRGEGDATDTVAGEIFADASGLGYGINVRDSEVYFEAGQNDIKGTGTATIDIGGNVIIGNGVGYGVRAEGNSLIKFTNSNPEDIQIDAFGNSEQFGIWADDTTSLKDKNDIDITGTSIDSYVKFALHDPSTPGAALFWNSILRTWRLTP